MCFAFATEDAAELNAHSEACFALAAAREAGAAPAAEAHFRRFMAHRSLPLIQSSAVLMTLNSLGTAVRMALALTSSRWARNSSVLGYLPMLHATSPSGPAPVTALRVPEEVARRICHIVLPFFGLLRLPVMVALFVCSTSPSWREWCAPHGPLDAAACATRPHRHRSAQLRGSSGAGLARGPQPWSRSGSACCVRVFAPAVRDSLWFHSIPLVHATSSPGLCARFGRGRVFVTALRARREFRLTCASLHSLALCLRYITNHVRMFTAAILVETFTSTILLEGVVWYYLQRVVVWPPAMVICSTLGDIIGHHMLVRARRPAASRPCISAAALRAFLRAEKCAEVLRCSLAPRVAASSAAAVLVLHPAAPDDHECSGVCGAVVAGARAHGVAHVRAAGCAAGVCAARAAPGSPGARALGALRRARLAQARGVSGRVRRREHGQMRCRCESLARLACSLGRAAAAPDTHTRRLIETAIREHRHSVYAASLSTGALQPLPRVLEALYRTALALRSTVRARVLLSRAAAPQGACSATQVACSPRAELCG